MDEAGQGIVLSSPPKCGVPVARVGLIDRSIESWLQIIMLQPGILLRCRNPRIAISTKR